MTYSFPDEGASDSSMRKRLPFSSNGAEAEFLFRRTDGKPVQTGTRQLLPIHDPANFAGLR